MTDLVVVVTVARSSESCRLLSSINEENESGDGGVCL